MNLLKSYLWKLMYPFMKWRYSLKVANSNEEKESVFKFRYQIYRNQLEHHFLESKEERKNDLTDELDHAPNSFIIYASHKNHIIGTIRITIWDAKSTPHYLFDKYNCEKNVSNEFAYIGEFRFLQIDQKYAKTYLALALMTFMGEVAMEHFSPEILFLSGCQPGLLHYYYQLGCFSYSKSIVKQDDYPILQLPIGYILGDLAYLRSQGAIVYHITKKVMQQTTKDLQLLKKITHTDYVRKIPHFKLYPSQQELAVYKNILQTQQQKNHFDILTSVTKPIILDIPKDVAIITNSIIEYDIYMLLTGSLSVLITDNVIAKLDEGEIFGEMAFFTHEHKRSSDVKSITNVKLLIVSKGSIERLQKINPHLANKVFSILGLSLAEKLTHISKRIAKNY